MCISHPLDARAAALRAAVGCGWTYRRDAAWAWHVMPICAFRRSCSLAGNYGASRLRCLRESTKAVVADTAAEEKRTTLSLSLTVSDKKALKLMAAERETTIAAIIHEWVQEHLEEVSE